ncbi:hypothetical protein Tco_0784401 [Tanacetum coccineum]
MDPPLPQRVSFSVFRSNAIRLVYGRFLIGAKRSIKRDGSTVTTVPEIDTYRAQIQSLFPEQKTLLEELHRLICERHANNLQDPEVSTTSELFALANGPSRTPIWLMLHDHIGGTVGGEDLHVHLLHAYRLSRVASSTRKRKRSPIWRRESRQEDPGGCKRDPGPYSSQWGNYFGEMIRSIPLYHPSWQKRALVQKMTSQPREPSEIDTFYRLHTVNGVFQDPEALRIDAELEATIRPTRPELYRTVDKAGMSISMMNWMRSDNRFADAFARYDSGGASGSGGSRARDREDGDDTGGEDGGDDTIVVSVYRLYIKKNCRLFPSDMSLGKIPLKDKTIEAKSVEKSNSKGPFPSDMSLGKSRSFPSDMSLGKILPPWHQFLDQKIRGAHFSLGNVLPSSLPHQPFPSDISLGIYFPSDMSLAKGSECCWGKHRML